MFTSEQTLRRRCGGFKTGTVGALALEAPIGSPLRASAGGNVDPQILTNGPIMEPASFDGMPNDVLIVEDDPIIALDFEDTLLGFGVKTIRTAASVARALQMIADQTPDFALLDVGLIYEKSYAIAERLNALKVPFAFVTGYSTDVSLPAAFTDRPRLPKPFSTEALQAVLQSRSGKGA